MTIRLNCETKKLRYKLQRFLITHICILLITAYYYFLDYVRQRYGNENGGRWGMIERDNRQRLWAPPHVRWCRCRACSEQQRYVRRESRRRESRMRNQNNIYESRLRQRTSRPDEPRRTETSANISQEAGCLFLSIPWSCVRRLSDGVLEIRLARQDRLDGEGRDPVPVEIRHRPEGSGTVVRHTREIATMTDIERVRDERVRDETPDFSYDPTSPMFMP